MTINLKEMH